MNTLVAVLAGIGSTLGVVAVVWGLLKEWVAGPRLRIELCPPASGKTRPGDDSMRYRHLRVTNGIRRWPAHGVRVYLTRVVERRGDGPDLLVWDGLEVRMYWQWERQGEVGPRTVGTPAVCDLLSVTKSKKTVHIEVIEPPWNLHPELPNERRYVLTFVARADEGDSPPFDVEVRWDGSWGDDDDERAFFESHCSVKATTAAALARVEQA